MLFIQVQNWTGSACCLQRPRMHCVLLHVPMIAMQCPFICLSHNHPLPSLWACHTAVAVHAMYVCYVRTLWTCAMGVCYVPMPCTYAMDMCYGHVPWVPWVYAMYTCHVRMLWMCAMYVCYVRPQMSQQAARISAMLSQLSMG